MGRKARQELLQVAARLGVAALRGGGDRDDEVGALEPDREVGGAEEEPLDDPVELHVRRAALLQRAEVAAERHVALVVALVGEHEAELVLGVEQVVEALADEHQRRAVRPLGRAAKSGCAAPASRSSRTT